MVQHPHGQVASPDTTPTSAVHALTPLCICLMLCHNVHTTNGSLLYNTHSFINTQTKSYAALAAP
jgi:hypothetical protein